MTIYDIKPAFQNLLRPISKSLAEKGVTANQITLLALFLSIAVGVFLTFKSSIGSHLLIVPVALFIRMALNAIDGMLAREHNMKTDLGAVLNELGDVVSDTALFLPFALFAGFSPLLVVLIVVFANLSEMAGVIAVQIGRERRYDGPMGKSDRAFVFGLLALLLALGVPSGIWINILLLITFILILLTIVNRVRSALKLNK